MATKYPPIMEAKLRAQLLELAQLYQDATAISAAQIGKSVANDNTLLARIAAGEMGFAIRTFDKLVGWFSDNWPEGLVWPDDVERPEMAPIAEQPSMRTATG